MHILQRSYVKTQRDVWGGDFTEDSLQSPAIVGALRAEKGIVEEFAEASETRKVDVARWACDFEGVAVSPKEVSVCVSPGMIDKEWCGQLVDVSCRVKIYDLVCWVRQSVSDDALAKYFGRPRRLAWCGRIRKFEFASASKN
ncbi:hypothetical protein CC86DRAFT_119803 [Ophiobolus disseminans]|uniref:Uncharacterized protein n=1 Tax=Ophiobolus disseminans TaxID=1469910 RepID=A0A6A6ZGU6_9PLEO|nr:hypothetical protein CC86DRAFT_119803 [Ophiobolus disseminans]